MRREISVDKQKAKSLISMANTSYERLGEISWEKYPSNAVVDMYDILHKYVDAICLLKGIKFSGDGAHYEMIEETKLWDLFTSAQVSLLQTMRTYRNRIQYEGFFVGSDFVVRNKGKFLILFEKVVEYYTKLT